MKYVWFSVWAGDTESTRGVRVPAEVVTETRAARGGYEETPGGGTGQGKYRIICNLLPKN